MTVLRDLLMSGMAGAIMGFIITGFLMALKGAPSSVFAEETWFLLFVGATVFVFSYTMLRSYKHAGRRYSS